MRPDLTKTLVRLSRIGKGPSPPGDLPDLRANQLFGTYRILRRLGTGGMGEVYLALDTRLGRHVAIKFLPPHMTSDEAVLRRFLQEARTASALNHPNILTIFEVAQQNNEQFIVSEFVDGITLRAAMQRSKIDPGTALEIAIQVASALMAAHAAGVVHRDLKPTNIMIRPDGYVKVIDFGLAKLLERFKVPPGGFSAERGRKLEESLTRPGTMVGTVDYMSPEQARSEDVDQRTDIWSLGILLYEMVAHKRPFDGDTESHVLVGILDAPTPPIEPAAEVPQPIGAIIERALMKDRAKRYQSAQEMLLDLYEARRTVSPSSGFSPSVLLLRPPPPRKAWLFAAISAVVIIIAAVLAWRFLRGPDWWTIGGVHALTFNGRVKMASLSPDGRYLAYVVSDPAGDETVMLKQLDQASEETKIPARKIVYKGLAFSPDNQSLFVVEKDEKYVGHLYRVPIVGERLNIPILEDIDGPPSFSPSGDRFAFIRFLPDAKPVPELQIQTASLDGSNRRTLLSLRESSKAQLLSWSPRGDRLAAVPFGTSSAGAFLMNLDLIDMKGRESRRPLPGWSSVDQPWWTSSGRSLIFPAATRAQGSNRYQLIEINVSTGDTHDITKDLAGYSSISLTRDGERLAAVKAEPRSKVWVSALKDWSKGEVLSLETEEYPSLGWIDSDHVVSHSLRSGFLNFWSFAVSTKYSAPITREPFIERQSTPIPGTSLVVLSSNRSGEFHLWRFDRESNSYTALTQGSRLDESPRYLPNTRSIVYTSWNGNVPHLYQVPLDGGASRLVSPHPARDADVSPDGQFIACYMENNKRWAVSVIAADGNGQPRTFDGMNAPVRWSPDAASLVYTQTDSRGVSNLWSRPLNGAPSVQLTRFEEDPILAFEFSPSGQRLACIRGGNGSDVVLFTRQK